MRKIGLLFLLVLFICGCDDGDLKAVSFDFIAENVKDCNVNTNKFYLYNTADKRVFILKIDENQFTKQITDGEPLSLPISGNVNVFYREYANTVDSKTVCSSDGIPSASNPLVTEWEALGGEVLISTSISQTEENPTTGATSIKGYQYRISFRNIAFNTGNGEQRNDFINFGTYNLAIPGIIDFGVNDVKVCAGNDSFFFNYSGTQALKLNINKDLLDVTKLGVKTEALDGVKNKVTYSIYKNSASTPLTDNFFCSDIPPVNAPDLEEEYVSIVGGQIEVTTSSLADKFKHVIKLKNVVLKKTGSEITFKLGFDFKYGEYITP